MRDGDQPAAGVAAEIGDPAVVRAAIGARELGLEQLGLPQQAERGIEHGLRHPLAVEQLHALLHVHGAEGGAAQVGLLRRGPDAPDLIGRDLPAHLAIAELLGLVDPLAHAAEGPELARPRDGGGPAVDRALSERAMHGIGYEPEDARILADHVLDAALCGYEYSGLPKLLNVAEHPRFQAPRRPLRALKETRVSVLFDGGNQSGMIGM